MTLEPTHEHLLQLGLLAMAGAWHEQQQDARYAAMPFDERFGLLIDAEWIARENKRIKRRLKDAKLKMANACFEAIDFPPSRKLDKAFVRQLGSCRWVADHLSILVSGATGTGKTFIACALAHQACLRGFRVLYRRASRLFEELTLAHADGTFARLLRTLERVDVLVIDDWGLAAPRDAERRDLLEILEDRFGNRSTIITSQWPPEHWYDHLGSEPTVADAICDRLLNKALRIALQGPSRRKDPPADLPGVEEQAPQAVVVPATKEDRQRRG